MKKNITVIIPTFNSEKTIERALKSVFSQNGLGTIFFFQVLICDDCSSDKTVEICKRFPVEILWTKKNSGGPNKGRNLGIKHATGDFIAFLDHDDEWTPNKTIDQIYQIRKGNDFVYSSCIKRVE
jgi:glycosyltransferase involved in cell wall biosynthesis